MSRLAYLSLGSNLGDRLGHLAKAVRLLTNPQTQVLKSSSVYSTAPQGKTDQPDFLNLVVCVHTSCDPLGLLRQIQAVEQQLGRVRDERWGPRTIDIDILLFGDEVADLPELTIPHPRMLQRAFVLAPLLEVDPTVLCRNDLNQLQDQGVTLFVESPSFMKMVREVQ